MAGILIFIILSFMIAFILTRRMWVNVKNGEFLRIEFHLPIFALILTKRNKNKSEKQKKKQKELSALTYVRIVVKTLKRFEKCEVIVKKIAPPQKMKEFSYSTLTKPYGYQSLIYALIAYLETKVEKLTLKEDAVTFIPGNSLFLCDITIKARLYEIAIGAYCLYRNIRKEKRFSFSNVG